MHFAGETQLRKLGLAQVYALTAMGSEGETMRKPADRIARMVNVMLFLNI